MTQYWRWLSLFGAAGLMLACALGPSRLILADGPKSAEGKSDTSEAKPGQNPKSNAAAKSGNTSKPGNTPKSERNAASAKAHAAATKMTPDREAAAIAFAGQNHPELASLLANLKQNNPTEYHAAVVELDRIVERLASLKPKNVTQHDSELAHWKIDSRIRLLAARLTMSDNPAIEAELKAAIRERAELTLSERKAERERLQKRVEKLDQTIGELSTKLDDIAAKELAAVKRTAQSSKPTSKGRSVKKGDENALAKPVEPATTNKGKDKSGTKTPLKEPKDN